MEWMESISSAITYIEHNLTEELTMDDIAKQIAVSPLYFQKGFTMLCGFTVSEYIRQRRLSLAGSELMWSDVKIIDLALKYGYDSPDSFTKAFTRFHGSTPSAVRKLGASVKTFAPLKINFSLKGGYIMDYKIMEKEAFTVLGSKKTFSYEEAMSAVPTFWAEHFKSGKGNVVCGKYGINMDQSMGGNTFSYMIADDYVEGSEIPDGFETVTIPKFTWAVFACKGAMPDPMQEMNKKIFSEWLPNCNDYAIAAGYNIELYADPAEFPNGTQDENYYSEIWIPVVRK